MTETAQVDDLLNQRAAETIEKLDELRLSAREITVIAAQAGLPAPLYWDLLKLTATIEFLERRVGDYTRQVDTD